MALAAVDWEMTFCTMPQLSQCGIVIKQLIMNVSFSCIASVMSGSWDDTPLMPPRVETKC